MTSKTQRMCIQALLVLLAAMGPCALAQNAKAQPRPVPPVRRQSRVTSAHLQAVPAQYGGACPATVHFQGTITTDGPAEVKYTWASFDGGTWPEGTLHFTAAGTKPVNESREVSGSGQIGWMELIVQSPNAVHSTQAKYRFACVVKRPPSAPRGK